MGMKEMEKNRFPEGAEITPQGNWYSPGGFYYFHLLDIRLPILLLQ